MLQRGYMFSICYTEDAPRPFNQEHKYLIMVIFVKLPQKNKNYNSYHLLVVNFTTTYKDRIIGLNSPMQYWKFKKIKYSDLYLSGVI